MKAFIGFFLSLFATIAWAADPFTVAKVPVDAQADTAIAAQTEAISAGQVRAARTLLERLTLESERMEIGLPLLDAETVGPLIRGLSIDNERRSTNRYLGDVTIAFNPSAVLQLLRNAGLTMVSNQTRERLAIPVGVNTDSPFATDLLSGRYAHALTPLISLTEEDLASIYGEPSEFQLQDLASRYNVEQVMILRPVGGGTLQVTDLSLDTGERNEFTASGGMAGLINSMETAWKSTSTVSSDSQVTAVATILYNSLPDWQRLQSAINTSSQIRDARLDALSKDGAIMTVSYGSYDRLVAEMRQKGVRVERDPELGLVIRR